MKERGEEHCLPFFEKERQEAQIELVKPQIKSVKPQIKLA